MTSIANKVPLLKAVQANLKTMWPNARLYGADANPQCLGRYFVETFWQTPPLVEMTMADWLAYCSAHDITAIIPTRDGELAFFAAYSQAFLEAGVRVMVPCASTVQICLDKWQFAQILQQAEVPTIPTLLSLDANAVGAWVVKPRFGAGAQSVYLNVSAPEALVFAKQVDTPIFQPFVTGTEWSIDVYCPFHTPQMGTVHGIVTRRRDVVVGGESQITTSQRYDALAQYVENLAQILNIQGHAVFQVIETPIADHPFVVVECNARIGGASTLSFAVGLDSIQWFLQEAWGTPLTPFKRYSGEKRLLRHATDWITDDCGV